MATPQELQRLLNELNQAYARLGEQNPFANFDTQNLKNADQTVRQLEAALRGVQNRISAVNDDIGGVASAFSSTVDEIKNMSNGLNGATKAFRGLGSIATKLKYDQEGISKLNSKDLLSLQRQYQQKIKDLELSKGTLIARQAELNLKQNTGKLTAQESRELRKNHKALEAINGELKIEDNLTKTISDRISARIAQEERVNQNLGLAGTLLKGIKGTLDKIGLGALGDALGIEDALSEMRKVAEELEESEENLSATEKKRRTFQAGVESIGESLKKNLNDPLFLATVAFKGLQAILKPIIAAIKEGDLRTGELAKNLNLTYSSSLDFRKELYRSAALSGELFVNSKGLEESVTAINQQLGTSVRLNNQNLITFTKLREQAGLTNEEILGINSLSLATGGNLQEMTGEFLAQARLTGLQNKAALNEKQLLKDISNISAATTLSFSKNPTLLAEAVATAKSLGMELSKVEGIADSLLNFEQSIESELQAELLLGKNINLEKARQAALNNDLATLAQEISREAGTSAEFAKMNRIQQESIARAVGMNREDLAKTLFLQEQLVGASEEEAERREQLFNKRVEEIGLAQAQAELAKKGFEGLENQASASEKMVAATAKIKEAFMGIGNALLPVVEAVASVAGYLAESKFALVLMKGLVVGITAGLAALAVTQTITAAKMITSAVGAIFTGTASLGPFGIPLAVAGVAALLGGITSAVNLVKGDDMISPGYGKRTIFSPEGSIALNNKDTIIAGTNLNQNQNNTPSPINIDNKTGEQTNRLLATLINQNSKKPQLSPVGLYEVQ